MVGAFIVDNKLADLQFEIISLWIEASPSTLVSTY